MPRMSLRLGLCVIVMAARRCRLAAARRAVEMARRAGPACTSATCRRRATSPERTSCSAPVRLPRRGPPMPRAVPRPAASAPPLAPKPRSTPNSTAKRKQAEQEQAAQEEGRREPGRRRRRPKLHSARVASSRPSDSGQRIARYQRQGRARVPRRRARADEAQRAREVHRAIAAECCSFRAAARRRTARHASARFFALAGCRAVAQAPRLLRVDGAAGDRAPPGRDRAACPVERAQTAPDADASVPPAAHAADRPLALSASRNRRAFGQVPSCTPVAPRRAAG